MVQRNGDLGSPRTRHLKPPCRKRPQSPTGGSSSTGSSRRGVPARPRNGMPGVNCLQGTKFVGRVIFLGEMSKRQTSFLRCKFDRAARTVLVRWLAVAGVGI